MAHIRSELTPVYDENSKILILGSFPSVKSREQNFFYGHPQNRFWRVLPGLFGEELSTVEEKKAFLLRRHIALWDVIDSCDIEGSSDASIENVKENDLTRILSVAPIEAIFCNGGTAKKWYDKLLRDALSREAVQLPSTSPANARCSREELTRRWRAAIAPYLTDAANGADL